MKTEPTFKITGLSEAGERRIRQGLAMDLARRALARRGIDISKCLPVSAKRDRLPANKEART